MLLVTFYYLWNCEKKFGNPGFYIYYSKNQWCVFYWSSFISFVCFDFFLFSRQLPWLASDWIICLLGGKSNSSSVLISQAVLRWICGSCISGRTRIAVWALPSGSLVSGTPPFLSKDCGAPQPVRRACRLEGTWSLHWSFPCLPERWPQRSRGLKPQREVTSPQAVVSISSFHPSTSTTCLPFLISRISGFFFL